MSQAQHNANEMGALLESPAGKHPGTRSDLGNRLEAENCDGSGDQTCLNMVFEGHRLELSFNPAGRGVSASIVFDAGNVYTTTEKSMHKDMGITDKSVDGESSDIEAKQVHLAGIEQPNPERMLQ